MPRHSRRIGFLGAFVRCSCNYCSCDVARLFLTFCSSCFPDILGGQTLQYTEELDRASDVLFDLRERIPETEPLWLVNVDNALANMFLKQGKWRLALGSLDRIMELIPAATEEEVRLKYPSSSNVAAIQSFLSIAYKCEILSRQGRALLQVGAFPQVAEVFESARKLWDGVPSTIPEELQASWAAKRVPVQMQINEALFFFAQGNYDHSTESFSKAVTILRESQSTHSAKYQVEDWMGPTVVGCEAPNALYSECINNLSLCSLYTCRMKEAVHYLEGLVREDPTAFLTERVAFNLCTLYELGSDAAASARRKRVLQLIAKRFFLHDVGPESFRVT